MSVRGFGGGPRGPRLHLKKLAFALLAIVALVAASQTLASGGVGTGPDWATYGYDAANTRDQPFEHDISTANVGQLAQKWVANTTGDVSATPAVVNGAVYFGDFGGTIWKLDANTGAVLWQDSVPTLTGLAGDYARTSPAVDVTGNVVIFGTNKQPYLLGLDATTGAKLWQTLVNPDLHGTMTGSPQLVGDTVLTGVSAAGANNPGATFRGDIASVDALTGHLNWESFSLPGDGTNHPGTGQYAGATMFSAPAVDVADNLVYGTFGNLYSEPAAVAACNQASPNGYFNEACEQPGAYWDSIVAFDLTTGAPVWSYRVVGDAPWHRVCDTQAGCLPENDTPVAGLYGKSTGFGDAWDVGGSSPNVFKLGTETVVGFGSKTGVYYLFDATTGALKWNTLVGAGGDQGGFEWGTAVDGNHVYVSLTDQHHLPYQLTQNGVTGGPTVTGGSWASLDAATGKIIWQVADPQTETIAGTGTVGVWDLGPATIANGVDYVASMAKTGSNMYALDASNGNILWSYASGASVNAGPAIVNGSVYWGSGYSKSAEGSLGTKLFAFSINGVVDTTGPTTTITLSPAAPNGSNGWYKSAVGVSVGATDNAGGVGVYQTRCVVDPSTPPSSFADLPAGDCSLSSVTGDGTHTIYAASEDKDNNVGPVVSSTFKIDATAPTITAAATTSPNANGWYSGPVTVHFTCTDGTGSGIPSGACPPDQTLNGIGSVSSTTQTVTDAAGNTSAPSNVVTVKIVNATSLCTLTEQDVRGSTKYQHLKPIQKVVVDVLLNTGCAVLDSVVPRLNPAQKQVFVTLYKQVVQALQQQGWLTAAQAANLNTLAGGL